MMMLTFQGTFHRTSDSLPISFAYISINRLFFLIFQVIFGPNFHRITIQTDSIELAPRLLEYFRFASFDWGIQN